MSWFKLDDQGHDHPKVLRAGNEAYGAWCRAGQWSSKHLTEGVIPREVALTIAPLKVWSRLLSVGLLEEHPDGWVIHDFLTYNPTSEHVRSERARKAKNVSDHRARQRSAKATSAQAITAPVTGYTACNLRPLLPGGNHGPDPDPLNPLNPPRPSQRLDSCGGADEPRDRDVPVATARAHVAPLAVVRASTPDERPNGRGWSRTGGEP